MPEASHGSAATDVWSSRTRRPPHRMTPGGRQAVEATDTMPARPAHKEEGHENQAHQRLRGGPGQGPALLQGGRPAVMFHTDDVKGDYERIKARGAQFTMPPTDVTASTIAMLNDTCGNLIQLTQLARY